MGIDRPYRRTCRQFVDGSYSEGGRLGYLSHPKYAESAVHYARAFLLLQADFLKLFEYIEPARKNQNAYSFRVHELLFRVCVEVEANCVAILKENGYKKSGDWNMGDYKKIEVSHHLSSYSAKLPVWNGSGAIRKPFAAWKKGKPLSWYSAYNHTKHDRHALFHEATFRNLIDAMAGLVVLLSAQFYNKDFSPADDILTTEGKGDGMESAIGSYFRVKFPNNWPKKQRYSFDWSHLKGDTDPFQNYPY